MVIYDLPHSGEKVYAALQPATAGAGTALYTNYTGFTLNAGGHLRALAGCAWRLSA